MRPNQQSIFQGQGQLWGKMGATSFVEEIWAIASSEVHDQHAKIMGFISSLTSSKHGCLEDMYYLELSDFYSGVGQTLRWCDTCGTDSLHFFPSVKFSRDLECELCRISEPSAPWILMLAGKQKAILKLSTQYELLLTQWDVRCPSLDTRP